jgi:hypothetical protein
MMKTRSQESGVPPTPRLRRAGRSQEVRRFVWLVLCLVGLLVSSCRSERSVSSELSDKDFASEVVGHLYRWYLDEVDVQKATGTENDTIWVRELHPELDKGDNSLFGEVLLPVLGVSVLVKKADYEIEELGLKVKSDKFKIVRVSRIDPPSNPEKAYVPVVISGPELRQYLFNKRGEVSFPDDKLVARLREAVREEAEQYYKDKGTEPPDGPRIVHFAPLSPVANELWVFWEQGRMLVHYSSDLDLTNTDVWEHSKIKSKIYDLDEQVVVSLHEAPGSNAYLTRDQVGRALYNCVVLGRRYELRAPQDK